MSRRLRWFRMARDHEEVAGRILNDGPWEHGAQARMREERIRKLDTAIADEERRVRGMRIRQTANVLLTLLAAVAFALVVAACAGGFSA